MRPRISTAKGDGSISIDGGAGTRDCDWVFTNEAVFIDTAGRFTSQTSNQAVDSASWTGFLDLLRKYRPREPINGVIVSVSVKDLATDSTEELDQTAADIRDRLQEVCDRMQARVPVYVMFTKADLLVGFTEFFHPCARMSASRFGARPSLSAICTIPRPH